MPANFPTLKSSIINRQRLLFQCNAQRRLLLIAQDCDARMHSAASLPRVPQEILCVVYQSVVENYIAGYQASLVRRAGLWCFQTVTPVSPGVPAAETSSNPPPFRTFAPSHTTTVRLRFESRVTDWGLVVDGSSGVRAIAFNSGTCTRKSCISKLAKPSWSAGESAEAIVWSRSKTFT